MSCVLSSSCQFINLSTAMLILNQICPHLLHFITSLPACVLSTPHHFITLSSVKTTLTTSSPHLLHLIKSLPACVLSTPHHFITLSSVKTTLNQVQQFIKISVLKLLISPNLICTLQDLVQAPPILPDLHLSCSKQCCCVFLRLLQSRSAPT